MSTEKAKFTLPEWVKVCLVLAPLIAIGAYLVPAIAMRMFGDISTALTTDYSNHEVVEARVVRTETSGPLDQTTHVWVSYEVDGQAFDRVGVGDAEITTGENGGRVVELLVHPDDPSDVVTRGSVEGVYWALGASLFMAALFIVVMVCAVGVGVQGYRQYRARLAGESRESGDDPG